MARPPAPSPGSSLPVTECPQVCVGHPRHGDQLAFPCTAVEEEAGPSMAAAEPRAGARPSWASQRVCGDMTSGLSELEPAFHSQRAADGGLSDVGVELRPGALLARREPLRASCPSPGQPCHPILLRHHSPPPTRLRLGCWTPNGSVTAHHPLSGAMWCPARCPRAGRGPSLRESRAGGGWGAGEAFRARPLPEARESLRVWPSLCLSVPLCRMGRLGVGVRVRNWDGAP